MYGRPTITSYNLADMHLYLKSAITSMNNAHFIDGDLFRNNTASTKIHADLQIMTIMAHENGKGDCLHARIVDFVYKLWKFLV
jgi:hypothetical protein